VLVVAVLELGRAAQAELQHLIQSLQLEALAVVLAQPAQ
jgi:hypothetical protein